VLCASPRIKAPTAGPMVRYPLPQAPDEHTASSRGPAQCAAEPSRQEVQFRYKEPAERLCVHNDTPPNRISLRARGGRAIIRYCGSRRRSTVSHGVDGPACRSITSRKAEWCPCWQINRPHQEGSSATLSAALQWARGRPWSPRQCLLRLPARCISASTYRVIAYSPRQTKPAIEPIGKVRCACRLRRHLNETSPT